MNRASHLQLSVPAWAIAAPDGRPDAAGQERRRLSLAASAPAEVRDPDDAEPAGRDIGLRVALAPRVEPPAHPIRAEGPAHLRPPVLGSREALARRSALSPVGGAPPLTDPVGPLPDPTRMCCAMVQAAVEGLRGARPLAQLTRWVSPEVYDRLALRAQLVQGAGTPLTTGRAGIRRIRVCRIGHDTAEATVVVDDGPRVRAVAVRLEGHRGRWRATAMEIG